MNTEHKTWEEATPDEIRRFARTAFGLDVSKHMTREQVRAELAKVGFTGEKIAVFAEARAAPGVSDRTTPGRIPAGSLHYDETSKRTFVCIRIPHQDKPGGREPVPLNVNGRAMYVPRERACWIGEEYHEVLLNAQVAMYREYDPSEDFYGGIETDPEMVKSFPFSYDYVEFTRPGAVAPRSVA
jgi:hypothetical protein